MARVWLGAGFVTGMAIVAMTASMIMGSSDAGPAVEQSAEAPGSDSDTEDSDATTSHFGQDAMKFFGRLT